MNSKFVTDWVIDTVRNKYPDDIALIISHSTLRIDDTEKGMSYFVPVTDRGNELSRTFILEGVGYDIWSVSWERLERFAALEEYNVTCLADGEILYAKNKEYADKFLALKARQAENFKDSRKMRILALEAYAQAKNLYLEMLFAQKSDIRLAAGYILDYLAQAVAYANHTYFKKAQINQLEEMEQMSSVPAGFQDLYLSIIKENNVSIQKKKCQKLICIVRDFLSEGSADQQAKEHNYQDLSDWYAELSYTWLRLRHYAGQKDFLKVYMWGIYLQRELNIVSEDFGFEKPELMVDYDSENLERFIHTANEIEKRIRQMITSGQGVIHEYKNAQEFLNENT